MDDNDLEIPGFLKRSQKQGYLEALGSAVDALDAMQPIPPKNEEPQHSFTTYEAIKIAYKQQIEGNVVTFRLNFDQDVSSLANLPLGSRVVLAIAQVKE